MRELRLTDAELQQLVATSLREALIKAGFARGSSVERVGSFMMPINLDLAGNITIERGEDGVWTFRQTSPEIDVVLDTCRHYHVSAMTEAARAWARK